MISRTIKRLLSDEAGSITVEIGLIATLSAAAAVAGLDYRSSQIEELFLRFGEKLEVAVTYLTA